MKKTTKRLVVGTLLCSMVCMEVPAWTYGTDTVSYVQAAETNRIIQCDQIAVSFPSAFPMGEHLAEGIHFEDCIFESSDTSIAIVNEEGTVIPLCDGIVDITVTTKDGRKDTRSVKIEDNGNIAFTLDEGEGTHHGKQAIVSGSIPSGYGREKDGDRSVLRIASTIHGEYQVRKIAPNAFQGKESLETVVLPESMAYVEEKAFADCTNLKTVFVTGMNTTFEEDTFEGDEVVLKGFKGSKAEEYAKSHDNITFEVIDVENDDYYPYEEAIYFTRNYTIVNDKLSMSTKEKETLYPAVASSHYCNADIEYTSSNNQVAVIKDGIITGKKAGTVTITASLPNGVEKSIEVTVEGEENILDEVKANDRVIHGEKVGVSFPSHFPLGEHLEEGISFKDCVFESSDTSIAIVNEEGTVIPLCDGVVEITATTKDGRKDTCIIEIADNNNVQFTLDEGEGTHYGKQAIINGQVSLPMEQVQKIRKSSVLRIASTIHGEYQVRKIAPNAFQNAKHLEKVVLPEYLLYVDNKAFADCTNLKTVFVTGMNTTFEEDTFEGDEIVLKGFEGSKAEEYAKSHDNITFEVIDVENDDYQPYEETIYFSRNYRIVEDEISMSAGENETLYPAVASVHYGISDISYASSDNNIASVKDGIITGKKAGTVTITASLPNGVERAIKVTVEEKEVLDEAIVEPDTVTQQSVQKKNSKVSKIRIKFTTKKSSIKVGKHYQFKANVLNAPEDTSKKIKWSVSNKELASINKTTGKLKAKKAGKIVVKASYGNVVKKLKVTIKK